jgi:mannitol/fructose-specific phosphotransferase system IIA component (Ntr-type)
MISISEILLPEHINLHLDASDSRSAVEELLFPLRGDIRIADWDAIRAAILERDAPSIPAGPDCDILIAHGRTNAVTSLVMSAGRSLEGFSADRVEGKVRLVFVVGIPTALSQDYLRIVGTIARLCGKPNLLEKLLAAPKAADFLQLLQDWENKL